MRKHPFKGCFSYQRMMTEKMLGKKNMRQKVHSFNEVCIFNNVVYIVPGKYSFLTQGLFAFFQRVGFN